MHCNLAAHLNIFIIFALCKIQAGNFKFPQSLSYHENTSLPGNLMEALLKILFARWLGGPAYRFVFFAILKICLNQLYLAVSHLEHMEIGPDVVKKCICNHGASFYIY